MACFETEDEGATKIAEYVFPFFLLFFSFITESCSRTGWGHGGKDTLPGTLNHCLSPYSELQYVQSFKVELCLTITPSVNK